MDKKTILAVALSALILFVYQFYVAKKYPDAYGLKQEVPKQSGSAGVEEPGPMYDEIKAERQGPATEEVLSFEELEGASEEIVAETDLYIVTLSTIGGCIKSVFLKRYPDPVTNEPLRLVDVAVPEEGIYNISGLGGTNIARMRYKADRQGNEVIFTGQIQNGVIIKKVYTFHNSYNHIDLSIHLYNSSTASTALDYSIVAGSNIDIPTRLDRRYAQIVSQISGKTRRDNGKKGSGLNIEGVVAYLGLQNKYFSVITKPSVATSGAKLITTESDNLLSILEIGKFVIEPQSGISHNFLLFAGPSKSALLKEYNLESALSYGFFGGISQLLLSGLALFQKVFRNWGVAIILLSAIVNLVLFPLSRKSYESMKKMQEIQPHMERLRSEHKDNPNKLNKEIMELYKKYNVNPMGGCLPLFLQIPVFIALYQGLMRSLELRGARFLWIRDLSQPDAVPLPLELPFVGDSLNILPILMAGAMVFQQRASMRKNAGDSPQAKQQQQMMVFMPLIFLFIMYNFPSGLVLYWLTNTLLTMFEQRAIMRS